MSKISVVRITLCLIALVLSATAGNSKIVYVRQGGTPTNDGTSWETATGDLRWAGIQCSPGDEIWVAAGTYRGTIEIPSGGAWYGGFDGTESTRSQRMPWANVTIFDGERKGVVLSGKSSKGWPATVLDGFTIRNGWSPYQWAGGINWYSGSLVLSNNVIVANEGGGVFCDDGVSLTVSNSIFVGNGDYAISCSDSSLTLGNNTIVGNDGYEGVICFSGVVTAKMANNIVAFNSSSLYKVPGETTLTLTALNNCFYGNGIYNYSGIPDLAGVNGNISEDPRLTGVECGNVHIRPDSPCRDKGDDGSMIETTDFDGQPRMQFSHVDIGADESDGSVAEIAPPLIVRVAPEGNDENDGYTWTSPKQTIQAAIEASSERGVEVWVKSGTYAENLKLRPLVQVYGGFSGVESERAQRDWARNVATLVGKPSTLQIVEDRSAFRLGRLDGFTISGGTFGVSCNRSSATISHNRIIGNFTGVECRYSRPAIPNNLIADNTDGVSMTDCGAVVANNTVVSNSGAALSGTFMTSRFWISNNIAAHNGRGIRIAEYLDPCITNNCAYANDIDYYISHHFVLSPDNISLDPVFRDPANGDYHLRWDSPCINAGSNDAPGLLETDLDGQARVKWGVVDIGADEYWPLQVNIDIEPWDFGNRINARSHKPIPVALYSTNDFDAAKLDISSVRFAGAELATIGGKERPRCYPWDTNGDGLKDLVMFFDTASLSLPPGTSQLTLSGKILGGDYVEGSDDVTIQGGK